MNKPYCPYCNPEPKCPCCGRPYGVENYQPYTWPPVDRVTWTDEEQQKQAQDCMRRYEEQGKK